MLTIRRLPHYKVNIKKQFFIKPIIPPKPIITRQVITRAYDISTISYFIGKGIILFTMFYCTLNWAHYRQLRKDYEDKKKK